MTEVATTEAAAGGSAGAVLLCQQLMVAERQLNTLLMPALELISCALGAQVESWRYQDESVCLTLETGETCCLPVHLLDRCDRQEILSQLDRLWGKRLPLQLEVELNGASRWCTEVTDSVLAFIERMGFGCDGEIAGVPCRQLAQQIAQQRLWDAQDRHFWTDRLQLYPCATKVEILENQLCELQAIGPEEIGAYLLDRMDPGMAQEIEQELDARWRTERREARLPSACQP